MAARLCTWFAARRDRLASAPLLRHDAAFYRLWLRRAAAFTRQAGFPTRRARLQLDWLVDPMGADDARHLR